MKYLSAAIGLDLAPHCGLLAERTGEPDTESLPKHVAQVWQSLTDRCTP